MVRKRDDRNEDIWNDMHEPLMPNLLSCMQAITVEELCHGLCLNKHHYGKFLVGQLRREFILTGEGEGEGEDVVTLLVDTNGGAIPVHTSKLLWLSARSGGIVLRFALGKRLAIREPLVEISSDGVYIMRVINPADVIFLDADGHSPPKPIDATRVEDLEGLRLEGNHFFTKENWAAAVNRYSQCIDQADYYSTISQENLSNILMLAYTNMAEARLRLGHYKHALSDADEALKLVPNHVKSLVRKGKAADGLGLFEESCKAFKTALEHSPGDKAIRKCLRVSTTALEQSRSGKYEVYDYFLKPFSGVHPPCADFVGPVEIRRLSHSKEGRGLFATRDVKAGELILVGNALASVPSDPNWERLLVEKLAKGVSTSKHQMAQLYSLARCGKHDMDVPSMELFRPGSQWIPPEAETLRFDEDIIRDVLRLNALDTTDDSLLADRRESLSRCGIWGLPSFASHSCTPNIFSCSNGDARFFRAAADIMKGEELTITYLNDGTLMFDVESRQAATMEGWCFKCKCARCLVEEKLWSNLSGIRKAFSSRIVKYWELLLMSRMPVMSTAQVRHKLCRAVENLAEVADEVEKAVNSHDSKLGPREKGWIRATILPAFQAKAILATLHGNKESIFPALKLVFDSAVSVSVTTSVLNKAASLLEEIERSYSKNSEPYRLTIISQDTALQSLHHLPSLASLDVIH